MEPITLSLRQRKLLNLIQNQTSCITGQSLAEQLNVSSRTVRNDIVEINNALTNCNARICAEKSRGYYFKCDDPTKFQEQFKTDDLLFTREDRIRYLAFQLCLSDIPLDQYDLEEEMFISKTTLENDIAGLKHHYVLSSPHISLIHKKDSWEFEHDEYKRRFLLNHLIHNDWDYNDTGNAYYTYHFLDDNIVNIITDITTTVIHNHSYQIEDANLVTLNLALAIMYYRVSSGHILPAKSIYTFDGSDIYYLCLEIFSSIETTLNMTFPEQEKETIFIHLSNSLLIDASNINFETASDYFDSDIIEMAHEYIQTILDTVHIDFSFDEDFYITLLQYLRHVKTPDSIFNYQGNPNLTRSHLLLESEIAYLFQPISLKYFGYYLSETELLYLSMCISGALEGYWVYNPGFKLRAVVCCHLNLAAIWSIKRKILGAFGNYLDIIKIIPVNTKEIFDFDDIDLIFTTVKKNINANSKTRVVRITPNLSRNDYVYIQQVVTDSCMRSLYKNQSKSLASLVDNAYWHENFDVTGIFQIIDNLAADFSNDKLVSAGFLSDILRHESTYSFGFQPGVLFMYSLVPAKESKLSIATFKHRIQWNSNKIRVIIMASFHPSETDLLLKLLLEIYNEHGNPEFYHQKITKEKLIEYYKTSPHNNL